MFILFQSLYVWGLTHAPIFNLTGTPAIVIPTGQSQKGLPIGIQVIGKRWKDMKLLAIAEQLISDQADYCQAICQPSRSLENIYEN